MPSYSREENGHGILIVTPDFPMWDGGISTVAYQLSVAFNKKGLCPLVVTPRQTDEDFDFDGTLDVDIIRLAHPKARLVAPYYQRLRLFDILRHNRPKAVVSCCWYPGSLALARLKALIRGPLVTIVHGSELIKDKFRSPFWQRRLKYSLQSSDILVAVSGYVKDMLLRLGLPESKIFVIGNGVDPDAFYKPPDLEAVRKNLGAGARNILLTVARLVARKGQDTVLRALPRVLQDVPDVKYLIVGKGNYEERLRQIVAELGLDSYVVFAGFVAPETLPTYYHASDLFVMPSRIEKSCGDLEGFGITFLEANICEKPVVAGRSGGVEDAVVHGKTGLLVNPDDEDDLAQAIITLLTHRSYAQALGSKGRRRVLDYFTWDRIAGEYLNLLGIQ